MLNKQPILFRRFVILMTLVAMALTPATLSAQTRMQGEKVNMQVRTEKRINKYGLRSDPYDGVYHFGSFWVEGAYSQFLCAVPDYRSLAGYGVGGGLSYLYQNGRFLLSAGVGVRYQTAYNAVTDFVGADRYAYSRVRDTQGMECELQYDFESRQDISRSLYLNVPVLVGAYFYRRWYILGGFKFQSQLLGSTAMSVLATSTATYDRYIGSMGEMDNHGLRKQVPLYRTGERVQLGLDVMASIEIGHEWTLRKYKRYVRSDLDRRDYRVRLSAFADFGILSIAPKAVTSPSPLYGIPEETRYDFDTFTMTHMLSSEEASGSVRNLFAGVKLSFYFGYKTHQKCIMCGTRGRQQYLKNYN